MSSGTGWMGGDNFHKVKRGSMARAGGIGDGSKKKKFGAAGMRKRIRFNPNVTINGHNSCIIFAQAKVDKALYASSPRHAIVYQSGLI